MVDAVDAPVLKPPTPILVDPEQEAERERSERKHAAHELILACLPLVDSIARRVYGALPPNAGLELHDLAQSGLLGLVSGDPLLAAGCQLAQAIQFVAVSLADDAAVLRRQGAIID